MTNAQDLSEVAQDAVVATDPVSVPTLAGLADVSPRLCCRALPWARHA